MTTQPPSASARSRWLRWGLQIALVVAVYAGVSAWRSSGALPTDGSRTAPSFALRSLDGSTMRLQDLHGKTVLLHFWATWCGVCRAEIPMLNALARSLEPDQALVTIVASDDPEEVRTFSQEHELDYPILFATREVLEAYGISAFPTHYVIDANGRVASHSVGLSTRFGHRLRMSCAGR